MGIPTSFRVGKVEVLIVDGPLATPCHIWQGATQWAGYPLRQVDGVRMGEHRRVWQEAHGPIPEGYDVHHLCGNIRCINVDHLAASSRSDHIRFHRSDDVPPELAAVLAQQTYEGRAVGDGRKVLSETCRRGHPWTPENTITSPSARGRLCRTCRDMRRQARKRAGSLSVARHEEDT